MSVPARCISIKDPAYNDPETVLTSLYFLSTQHEGYIKKIATLSHYGTTFNFAVTQGLC